MKTPAHLGRRAGACGKQLTLLPEPPFSPVWPQPSTLAMRCLQIFLEGDSLTHPQFEAVSFSWRLAAVVNALRELGWPVISEDIASPTAENPDRIISRYRLAPDAIAAALTLRGGRHA